MSEKEPQQTYRITIDAPTNRVWKEMTNTGKILNRFFGNRLATPGHEQGQSLTSRPPRSNAMVPTVANVG